jgi:hypothetical protein
MLLHVNGVNSPRSSIFDVKQLTRKVAEDNAKATGNPHQNNEMNSNGLATAFSSLLISSPAESCVSPMQRRVEMPWKFCDQKVNKTMLLKRLIVYTRLFHVTQFQDYNTIISLVFILGAMPPTISFRSLIF